MSASAQPREPMWYCHECNAEMRPLMMPDPHCASCQSTFVEKMENPADDPREFQNPAHGFPDPFTSFLTNINDLFRESPSSPDRQQGSPRQQTPSPITRREIRFEFGTPSSRRQFTIGGPNVLNRRESAQNASGRRSTSPPPRLSDYLRANSEASGASEPNDMNIPGQLMAQYLMALLAGTPLDGQRGVHSLFGPVGFGEARPDEGRWGDYVFTQEALDQLMTQLMEGANSTRPVPATEEIMDGLPREVLEEGSALLEKDCAVCKEQFSAKAEDPDEQVVVTLPCTHPFHEGCIMPWLKSSGTCPVCRYALVPQPNSHSTQPGPSTDSRRSTESAGSSSPRARGSNSNESPGTNSSSNNRSSPPRRDSSSNNHTTSAGSFFQHLFGNLSTGNNGRSSHSSSPSRDRRQNRRGSGDSSSSSRSRDGHIPGSWGNSLD